MRLKRSAALVTAVTLILVTVFSVLLRFNLTVVARHTCKPCLSGATGSQLTLQDRMRAIASDFQRL
jgi:hypothetical protein